MSSGETSIETDEINMLVRNSTLSTLTSLLNVEFDSSDEWDIHHETKTTLNNIPVFFSTLRQRYLFDDDLDVTVCGSGSGEDEDELWMNRMCVCVVAPWNLSPEDIMKLNNTYVEVMEPASLTTSTALYYEVRNTCLLHDS